MINSPPASLPYIALLTSHIPLRSSSLIRAYAFDAERWRSPAAGSGSGADAVGSQVQCGVRCGLGE
jgi:hypothetical protein